MKENRKTQIYCCAAFLLLAGFIQTKQLFAAGKASALDTEPAAGASAADLQHAADVRSVRDLLEMDLAKAKNKEAGATDSTAMIAPPAAVLAPRLVAMYGLGQALMAEVQVGNRAYLYVKGQAWPAGFAADAGVYQLKGMNGACVQLEKDSDRHSLCLNMLLGEVRP